MTEEKKPEIIFAPGCFDSFEGTQEELDELVAEIQKLVDSGELFENSRPLDIDELIEQDPELAKQLSDQLAETFEETSKRKLQ